MKAKQRNLILLALVVVAAVAATALLMTRSTGEAASVAGTRWDGPDETGSEYQVYFDDGGAFRMYNVEYDEWLGDFIEVEASWTETGDEVTFTFTDPPSGYTLTVTGTVDGADLPMVGEDSDGYGMTLTLRRVDE